VVATPSKVILFDTGPSPTALMRNAAELHVNLRNVSIVVLSHEHFDHIGGVPALRILSINATIYIPRGTSQRVVNWVRKFDHKIVIVNHSMAIAHGVAIVGPLYGPPPEEALLVEVCSFGPVLITGCSHPGITRFVEAAKTFTSSNVTMVIGGFHLIGYSKSYVIAIVQQLIQEGVRFIAPLHCSGPIIRRILSTRYPAHYLQLYVGSKLLLDP